MERDYLKELVDHKNAERRYKIVSLERRIDHLYADRNRSLFFMGLFLISSGCAAFINNPNVLESLQIQLDSLRSFDALKQYIEMNGPTSLFFGGCALFSAGRFAVSNDRWHRESENLESLRNSYEGNQETENQRTYVRRRGR